MSSGSQLAVSPSDKKEKASLVEFSSEALEDPNEGVTFGDAPVHCVCPHCEASVITFIDHEASWVTWILGFIVWFSLGWMAFWVLPLLWPAFKDVVHHCPRCLNVVERKSRISLPTFRSEVMTFKIGGCAVVLARKYVMIFVGLIAVISSVYCLRSTSALNMPEGVPRGPDSKLTWEDFLYDCGPRTSLRHRSSTVRTFEEKFRRKTFVWQGEVRQIREGFDVLFLKTKSVVMVRMHPPRYPRRDIPDVALLFGEERNKEVAELNPGDWVEFEATMTAHGHRGDPEVMVLWHVKPQAKPKDLPSDWKPESLTRTEEEQPSKHGRHGRGPGRSSPEEQPKVHEEAPVPVGGDSTEGTASQETPSQETASQETPDDGVAELVTEDPTEAI